MEKINYSYSGKSIGDYTDKVNMLISDFETNDLDYLRLIEALHAVRVEANVNNSEITNLLQSIIYVSETIFEKCTAYMHPPYGTCYKTKSGNIVGVGTRNFSGWVISFFGKWRDELVIGKAFPRLECQDDPQIAQQILDDYAEVKGWEIYED